MSSTISSTETITYKMKHQPKLKEFDAKSRLVRTSSLEKIRRINSYIFCSQHYYIVPALLTWLRSSHTNLQNTTQKLIVFFRSLLCTAVYKLYQFEFKSLTWTGLELLAKYVKGIWSDVETNTLLKIGVYFAAIVMALELTVCAYLLSLTVIPAGLIFLIVCWFYINYLHCQTAWFYYNSNKGNKNSRCSRSRKIEVKKHK